MIVSVSIVSHGGEVKRRRDREAILCLFILLGGGGEGECTSYSLNKNRTVKHQQYKYENEQEHSDNIITTQGQLQLRDGKGNLAVLDKNDSVIQEGQTRRRGRR